MPAETDQIAILERIRTVAQAARTTWFTYVATLTFVAVTLFDVEDIDFFALDQGTELPLIGVSVPVVSFFLFGAAIVTLVFAYLHVSLVHLWRAVGRAPSSVDGQPLSAAVPPWLVLDFALAVRRRLSRNEAPCLETTALGNLGVIASALVLYVAGPAVVAGLWYRSQPAHYWWLTTSLGLMLVLCLWLAWESWTALRRHVRGKNPAASRLGLAARGATMIGLGVVLVGVSLSRASWDHRDHAYSGFPVSHIAAGVEALKRADDRFAPPPAQLRPRPPGRPPRGLAELGDGAPCGLFRMVPAQRHARLRARDPG